MKKGIHPENYRPVVFKDMSNDDVFITRSTINAKETIEIDGVTYPLVKVRSLTLLTRSTLVSLSWSIQPDVLISS